MYTKPKSELFVQAIIPAFLLFVFLKFWLGVKSPAISTLMTLCFVNVGVFALAFMSLKLKPASVISVIIILLLVFSQILSIISPNYRVEDGVLCFQYWGIALVPVFYKLNHKLYKTINYIILLFFLYYIIRGVPPDEIFSVSRNFISVVLLICTGYQIISSYQNNKRPSLILLLLSLIVAIWSIGRSGISTYLFLLICYPFISNLKFHYKVMFITFIVLTCVALYIYLYESLFVTAISRFQTMGFEDIRETVNKDYFFTTIQSPLNVLIGTPLTTIKSMFYVDYNPHNSFIRLHIFYGLFGFIIVISTLITSLFKYLVNGNYIFMIMLIALIFRSAVDSTSFHGPLDILIYFFLFFPLKKLTFVMK